MGPVKLVRHMQNPSYTYDTYLICMGLGPSISSDKSPSYSGPSYLSSPVLHIIKIVLNTSNRVFTIAILLPVCEHILYLVMNTGNPVVTFGVLLPVLEHILFLVMNTGNPVVTIAALLLLCEHILL